MLLLVIIFNICTAILIIVGILFAIQSPGKQGWLDKKEVIGSIVLVLAVVACGINIYLSRQDELHIRLLSNKLDSLLVRKEITDDWIRKTYEKIRPIVSTPEATTSKSKMKGNIAGFVKTINGKGLLGVTITRVINNVQTTSHENGAFIVVSVTDGELLRFQKDGYKDFDYKSKASDFDRLVEIKIKED